MSRKTFTVTAERGRGPWWVTECAEAGCVSQVRRLDQVADDIREAIAYQTGLSADEFDIDRKLKPSFTFGFGPHMCIGQYLAKMELSIAINAVLDLFPNIRLDPDRPAPVIAGSMLRGASSVPVIWD